MRGALLILALAAVTLVGWAQTAEDLAGQADAVFQELWATEYTPEAHDALQARLEEAISLSEQALALDEGNVHVLVMLARCYYTLADMFLAEEGDKKAAYIQGQEYGERALRADPAFVQIEEEQGFIEAVRACENLEALYWTYANWARKDEYDKIGAILRGDAPKLEALIMRAAELDEMYLCAGPLRSLGAFWGGLPRLPFGTYRLNLERADSYLAQAVEKCPEYLENLRFRIEFYLDHLGADGEAEAQELLQRILDAPLGDYPLYNSRTKLWAQARLED